MIFLFPRWDMLVPWRVFLKGPSWVHLHIIVVHRIHGFCRMIGHIFVQKKGDKICQKRLANAIFCPARRCQKQLITCIWWLFISSSCPPWTLNRAHSLMNWLWSKTLNPQIQLLWKPNIKQTSNDPHLQERHATFSTFFGQNYLN